ncbi:MRM1 rRNA methyltransferase 1 [Candida maltosa Xu316]|uniref:rRNA methyltransferase 1, mitochondrial n=1 Tax=Candida maltosa (strain Xu316) TaxID=1245528 RepID=M3K7F4_CANMX|nr:hypothetical protein G210_0825 [Candida maltosa Xu316]
MSVFTTPQHRSFSIASVLLKSVSRPTRGRFNSSSKPHQTKTRDEFSSFSKNFPTKAPTLKPWEKKNIDKDSFFKRKYGNISPESRQALDKKVERQRRFRDMKKSHVKEIEQKVRSERDRSRMERDSNRRPSRDNQYDDDTVFASKRNDTFFDYVFGTHPVKSVLLAGKRIVHELYVYNNTDPSITEIAEEKYNITAKHVRDKHALNVLCNNGVHNGVVLRTNKLEVPHINELGHAENGEYTFSMESLEDGSNVVQNKPVVREAPEEQEQEELFPLVLYLDEITDPQNMGSIIRSAYFFGVDMIVLPDHTTAKLGPIANKASAGTLDLIDIYQTNSGLKFMEAARKNGWNVISTSGKPDDVSRGELKDKHTKTETQLKSKFIELDQLRIILKTTPVVLIIGSEGAGVRTNMKLRSDFLVGVPKYRPNDSQLDSLNVGVATGIILQSCLGK